MFEALESRALMAADFAASINFQPAGTPRAPGLISDYGETFGTRTGGLEYGWNTSHESAAVDRNLTSVQKNDTFINLSSTSSWEIAVPNGTYQIFIVAGDLAAPNEHIALSAEGQLALAGITRKAKPFVQGPTTVNVEDGKLTITAAGAYGTDKINYLAIQQQAPAAPDSVSLTGTLKWTKAPDQLVARVEPESAMVGSKLYVFSGYGDIAGTHGTGWQPSKTFDTYDFNTNKWTRIGNMPIATTHAACTVIGTDIWFGGGYTARAGTTDKQDIGSTNVWIYHTTTNKWEAGPALPQKRASGGFAVVNNKLYFVAGEPVDHKSNPKDVWALDLNNRAAGWVAKAPIPEGRTHFGIAVVNNIIYIMGGQLNIDANATFLKTNYSYNPATNSWKRLADMPTVLSHNSPNTLAVAGQIYLFGGEYKFNFDTAQVLKYDPVGNQFARLTPLPGARAAGAAGYYNGKFVFAGGKNNGFFDDTWIGSFIA